MASSRPTGVTRYSCCQYRAPTPLLGSVVFSPALKATIRGSDGKLSIAKLLELRPLVANAARDGLVWKVLRWEIDEACPRLAEVLQATGNAGQQAARPVTELQCLQRIIKDAALVEGAGNKPDWNNIVRKAERIAPKLKGR